MANEAAIENQFEEKIEQMLSGAYVRPSSMIRRRKEKFDFWQIYGMVVGLILIVVGGCLGFLWQNLLLYERSMPEQALAQFTYPLIQGGLPRLMVNEAAKPAKYETSLERDAYIRSLLAVGELVYLRSEDESSGDMAVYLFKAGGATVAAVTLEKIHAGRFGYWEAVDEEIRMPIYGNLQVSVPQGASVTVNGVALFNEDKIMTGIPDEEPGDLPQNLPSQLVRDLYLLKGLYKKPLIEALGLDGKPLEAVWSENGSGPLVMIIPTPIEGGVGVLAYDGASSDDTEAEAAAHHDSGAGAAELEGVGSSDVGSGDISSGNAGSGDIGSDDASSGDAPAGQKTDE